MADEEFAALLERVRQGDQQAMTDLAHQYEGRVRLMARVLLGPALRPYLDSVDLVQSVHRSLLVGLRQNRLEVQSPEHLLALALTMVRRKVARVWRRGQRQQRLSSNLGTAALPDVLAALSSTRDDPAAAARFTDQVRQLCSGLSEADRQLLDLRVQGYSTAEIAQTLGIQPVALRVRLVRLRQRLQASGVLEDWL